MTDLETGTHHVLDLACPPSEVETTMIEEVCRKLLFVAVAKAQGYEGNESARLKAEGGPPRGGEDVTDPFREAWEAAATPRARLKVVKQAQEELQRLQVGPDLSQVRGTVEWKIAVALDDRPRAHVAHRYGISERYVSKLRKEYEEGKFITTGDNSRSTKKSAGVTKQT